MQAISGAGKTFKDWPEMQDNVIPYIGGEEEKSEVEPLKVWGHIEGDEIKPVEGIKISAQCMRVAVTDGHMATVAINFKKKPTKEQILKAWKEFSGTHIDRDVEGGMGVTVGRLREDNIFQYKFVGLSHNTLRGAAGGAVLMAELLYREGYLY